MKLIDKLINKVSKEIQECKYLYNNYTYEKITDNDNEIVWSLKGNTINNTRIKILKDDDCRKVWSIYIFHDEYEKAYELFKNNYDESSVNYNGKNNIESWSLEDVIMRLTIVLELI